MKILLLEKQRFGMSTTSLNFNFHPAARHTLVAGICVSQNEKIQSPIDILNLYPEYHFAKRGSKGQFPDTKRMVTSLYHFKIFSKDSDRFWNFYRAVIEKISPKNQFSDYKGESLYSWAIFSRKFLGPVGLEFPTLCMKIEIFKTETLYENRDFHTQWRA